MEEIDIIEIQGNYTLLEEKANLVHSFDQEIFQHLIETEATKEYQINEVEVVDDYKRKFHVLASAVSDAVAATVSVLRHNLMKPIRNAPENTAEGRYST
uniref:Uncharacterized protein n=1 Tax=Timema poppense TaxID=170557 RepID=A0A7R9DAS6_TIMPO|nr:unnamed protein product [Timema poppensis]